MACVLTEALNLHPRASSQANGAVSSVDSRLRARSNPMDQMMVKRQDGFEVLTCPEYRAEFPNLVAAVETYFTVFKHYLLTRDPEDKEIVNIVNHLEEAVKRFWEEFDKVQLDNFVTKTKFQVFLGVANYLSYEMETASLIGFDPTGAPEYKELLSTLQRIKRSCDIYVNYRECTTA
ncbi:hypothetical protein BGX29_009806 [Mortierella sp. GBA35]|nr:hypothetical protein BGX29_009806 [Mortierella sp. GBA35]